VLKKVLVANRAEIALRIIRACRDLGVSSVAIHSEADRGLRYVTEADEAVEVGAAPPSESYLAIDRILEAANKTGADSIHPGYGFLAENHRFARATIEAGLVFIGPPASVIESLGSKLETRRLMIEAGVPVVPGGDAAERIEDAQRQAAEIGYPVVIKPSLGGGGRGMRIVAAPEKLADALGAARREAGRAFASSEVYIEKLLPCARHIEVQIIGDAHGNLVHVGDRDCSLQRRYQKVLEEAPAPSLTDEQREHVRSLAVQTARAAGYVSAGTVEFLYDGEQNFYLLEVNTRVQVEHAVTEVISGIDLVTEQIRIASGEPLSFRQEDVTLRGAAIECRVYAEDPLRSFVSSPGRITAVRAPAGPWVREERSYDVGDEVTPYYDGLIAKLVVWGPTREIARARTRRALAEYRFSGIATNVTFLRWLTDSEAFRHHDYDTRFVEREFHPDLLSSEPPHEAPPPSAAPPMQASVPRPSPAPALSRGPESGAVRAELFIYHRRSGGLDYVFHIQTVPTGRGDFEAVPVSPRGQRWAPHTNRRKARTPEEAVDTLVREVLERKTPDEIFPETAMPY
jgi:acetyl-CoA carboxylase biotin carboxylase subunit